MHATSTESYRYAVRYDLRTENNKIKKIQNVRHRVCFATEIMGTAIVLNPHRSHAPRQGAMLQTIHYADVKQPKQVKKTKKYFISRF